MNQKFSSKDTSIKTTNRIYKDMPVGNGIILDYGCGKYNRNKEIAEEKGYTWYGFDPYNRPEMENKISLAVNPDIVICSNVLNVIAEETIINNIIDNLSRYSATTYITIYEGNKTGKGNETSKGYQRNEKASEYLSKLKRGWMNVEKVSANIYKCYN